jgi:transposase
MARYKPVDNQPCFLPVNLAEQLLPGTFEYALNHLVDSGAVPLSAFDAHYANDDVGAPAVSPAVLLKVVLLGYSRGLVSSRAIASACERHVTFIALCGLDAPHFTTIARFISRAAEPIAEVFQRVLLVCDGQGLIGREMFAIDGVKLPSNASKRHSGTRAELAERAQKMKKSAQAMLARHAQADGAPEPSVARREQHQIERLNHEAQRIERFLAEHTEDKAGAKGALRKSNVTDNDSAKMATDKGVIQGYCGVATVDSAHQIIMDAQAHGTGSEQALLLPAVQAVRPQMAAGTVITADAGYHSEANLQALDGLGVAAVIADNQRRQRDERLADQAKHKAKPDPLHDKTVPVPKSTLFGPQHFEHDPAHNRCRCPAGHTVSGGHEAEQRGYRSVRFRFQAIQCGPCELRTQCLRKPETTPSRQVAFYLGKTAQCHPHTHRMRALIDSPAGRALYDRRFATVEPVFANLRHNKGLRRFTLRGRTKVDAQWKLMCLVHNIEKLAHSGYGIR